MNIMENKQELLLLICILVFYALFILYNIYLLPPWFDEIISLLHISGNATPAWESGLQQASVHKAQFQGTTSFQHILHSSITADVHPPIYFFVTLAWAKLFGNEIESIRLISLFAILVTALLLYSTAETYKQRSGIITLLLFLSFPVTTWAAVNARDYALSLVFLMFVFFFSTKALSLEHASKKDNKKIDYCIIVTCLFIGISFLTHYFTILVSAFVYAFLVINFHKTNLPSLVKGGVLMAICALLVIPILTIHLGARSNQYSGFLSFSYEIKALLQSVFSIFADRPNFFTSHISFEVFYFLLFLFASIFAIKEYNNKTYLGLFYILLSALFIASLFILFYFTNKSLTVAPLNRYTIFIAPLLALIIGRLITSLLNKNKIVGLTVSLILCIFITSTWVDGKINAPPWGLYSRFNAIKSYIEDVGSSNTLFLIPKGYGRGIPGTWVYTLDGNQSVIIVENESDIDIYRSEFFSADVLIIANDRTKKLNKKLSELRQDLKDRQYTLVKVGNTYIWEKD